jgi:hypothetical protein
MWEVLKFGAMMMQLKNRVENGEIYLVETVCPRVDTRISEKIQNGKNQEGKGIDPWLKTHAPDIKRPTAYRFLRVAESVATQYQLPANTSFIDIATRDADQLPAVLAEEQLKLYNYVSGTSQRSWLDKIIPAKFTGGNHHPRCPHCGANLNSHRDTHCKACGKPTGATGLSVAEHRTAAQDRTRTAFSNLHALKRDWVCLNPAELDGAQQILRNLLTELEAHAALRRDQQDEVMNAWLFDRATR